MNIQCPSKTFLVGEYAVLAGAPAILLATPPYFRFEKNQFIDPYEGAGGFGASGAQFVFKMFQTGQKDAWTVWKKYRHSGLKGSGADVVLQWTGKITYFCPRECRIEKIDWPFESLYVGLIHTGHKFLTHDHLKALTPDAIIALEKIAYETYFSIKQKNQKKFLHNIKNYGQELNKLNLICQNTQNLLQKIDSLSFILSSKGCGAMGADVILCVLLKKNKNLLKAWCAQEKLNLIYCDNQFAEGISAS